MSDDVAPPSTSELLGRLQGARSFLPVCPECSSQRLWLIGKVQASAEIFNGDMQQIVVVNSDDDIEISHVRCQRCEWSTDPVYTSQYSDNAARVLRSTPFMRIWDKSTRKWTFEYSEEQE